MRGGLIVVQVSLSFVLLVGAGLLFKSLGAIQNTSPGFITHGVLTTSVDLTAAGYDTERARNFQDALTDRLQSLGGVQSVAFARVTPFSYRGYSSAPIAVDGYVIAARRASYGGLQRGRSRVFRYHGHPFGGGPRVHPRGQRNRAAGRGGERGYGGPILARAESGGQPPSSERTLDAGGGRRENVKVPELSGGAETVLLRGDAPEYQWPESEYPNIARGRKP